MVEKDEIRNQIVNSARAIFSKYGFKKTTMDEIAQATSKGKSSIYYYFVGKEEIYKAVIEKEATIIRDTIIQALANVEDPIDKLKIYVSIRMKSFRDMVNYYEAIKSELLQNLSFINKIREKYDRDEMDIVESFLKEGIKKELFEIEDTGLTAIAIVTAIKGLEIPFYRQSRQKNFEEHISHLLKVLFYGIVKRH
jgi:AcrR family transcriptional regulator